MIKQFTNESEFKDYNVRLGGAVGGTPSLWVSKSIFIGMTQDKFVGKFKVTDYAHNGKTKSSQSLEMKAKSLPCKLVIHMSSNKAGEKVSATVNLIDWGMIGDKHIGIIISGIA